MSETQTTPFKVTLKAGPGYEAPWVTVDGDDAADLENKLDSLTEGTLQKVADLASLLRAAHTATVLTTGEATPQAAATPQAQTASGGTVTTMKTCQHGVRVQRSGSKNGRSWTGYFCALPKGTDGSCKPIFED